ncbi:sugar kinase [Bacillus sp. Marseille-P3661]|uniref:sugar kinase n=1 Tax=Bacillus sp. Marseille-P3661 TaxID=1936234 RepID=UPI000C84244F|nr:sugar kinase [Bacillus sp. Marseille-P3661]
MKELDVVTFGETMVLFTGGDALPLEYVHTFEKQLGGAESNMAIGLKRLGHKVGWFSMLGDDPFGRYVHRTIRGEGVDTTACHYTSDAPQSIFFKEKIAKGLMNIYYYRKGMAASLLAPENLDEQYIAKAKVLHVTGITPALSTSCQQAVFEAIKIAKKHNLKVVFDPNIRYKLWKDRDVAREVMLKIAEQADVILPGLDEGQFLTGKNTPEEIAHVLISGANKTVVIKLGSEGSYYQTATDSGYVKGFEVDEVIDPVGAGDGFAAGIISGLLDEKTMEETLRLGNAIGAIVVGVRGDMEGLPTKQQVESFMSATGRSDVER